MRYHKKRADIGRPTRIEVNLGALKHNAQMLEAQLPQGCRLMAVVKAQAYGHGAVRVARALRQIGVRHFAVATMEEGIELRRAKITGEILILGYTAPAAARTLWRYRLTQTLIDADHAVALDTMGYPVRTHLKIDTGMHRIGMDARDPEAIAAVFGCRHIKICGVFTHLCVADESDAESVAFTHLQLNRFEDVCRMLAKSGEGQRLTLHACNSAGVMCHAVRPQDRLVRAGIALYGAQYSDKANLRPVLSFRSAVVLLRRVAAGEAVGYGHTWRAEKERTIAVVPVGYADGLPRCYGEAGGQVLLRGVRCPIVGRICMDQMTVDVTGIPDVAPGETVTLIGCDGGAQITADEVATACGTISYELLSRLGERPARIYFEGKE